MSAIDFTLPPLDTGYLSNPVRNDTAFDSSVKYFTDLFLDSVLQNDIVPQSILDTFDFDDIDPFVDALVENWDEVLTTNWRILTAITFGLFMALVLPITGAIWCCCSCICRKEPKPRKGSDRMVMCTLGWLFLAVILLCLLSSTWYIGADMWAYVNVDDLGTAVNHAVTDSTKYVANVETEISYLGDQNYDQLKSAFDERLDDGVALFSDVVVQVDTGAGLESLVNQTTALTALVTGLDPQISNLEASFDLLGLKSLDLYSSVAALQSDSNLGSVLAALRPRPVDVQVLIDGLTVVPFPAPPLSGFNVAPGDEAIFTAISDGINDAYSQLYDLPTQFNDIYAEDIRGELEKVGEEIDSVITDLLVEIGNLEFDGGEDAGNDLDESIGNWDDIVFFSLLIPAAITLFVILLYAVGLCLGLFGSVGSTTRTVGANIVSTGSVIFVIFAIILWFVVTTMFIVGATMDKLGCQTLEDPENSELGAVFDREMNELIHDALDDPAFDAVNFSLPDILNQCQKNSAVYAVFQLGVIYPVDDLLNWQDEVDPEIENIKTEIDDEITDAIGQTEIADSERDSVVLVAETLDEARTDLSSAYDAYDSTFSRSDYELVKEELVKINEDVVINGDPTLEGQMDVVNDLVDAIDVALQEFDTQTSYTDANVTEFEDFLTPVDGESLTDTVEGVLSDADAAFAYLETDGTAAFDDVLDSVIESLLKAIDDYVVFAVDSVENRIGGCRPFYNIYYSLYHATCSYVLDPYNWTWAGLGLLLLLFVPLLLLAVMLVSGLKKVEPQEDTIAEELLRNRWAMTDDKDHTDVLNLAFVSSATSSEVAGSNQPIIEAYDSSRYQLTMGTYDPAAYSPAYAGMKSASSDDESTNGKIVFGLKELTEGMAVAYNPADYFPGYAPRSPTTGAYQIPDAYKANDAAALYPTIEAPTTGV